jgi:membrane protein DedA with SNARE-associated domain
MDIAHLIQTYGYFALALGSFLEGEVVLIAGSLAAYHLALPLVMGTATLGGFMGDLPYFFARRRYGPRVLQRILYGIRIAGLLVLGMSKMSSMRFLLLNFIGAIVRSAGVCAAGYGAGDLLRRLFDKGITPGQLMLLAAVLAGTILLWIACRRVAASRD